MASDWNHYLNTNLDNIAGAYKILSVQGITLNSNGVVDALSSKTVSATFNLIEGATNYIPLLRGSGWLTPGSPIIDGNTLSCTFLNKTDNGHSGVAYYIIIALASL